MSTMPGQTLINTLSSSFPFFISYFPKSVIVISPHLKSTSPLQTHGNLKFETLGWSLAQILPSSWLEGTLLLYFLQIHILGFYVGFKYEFHTQIILSIWDYCCGCIPSYISKLQLINSYEICEFGFDLMGFPKP